MKKVKNLFLAAFIGFLGWSVFGGDHPTKFPPPQGFSPFGNCDLTTGRF